MIGKKVVSNQAVKIVVLCASFLAFCCSCNTKQSTRSKQPSIVSISPKSGLIGSVITISGTNLISVRSVKFGSITATFLSVSSTTLLTTVPPKATTGTIVVTTAYGWAKSSTFTVLSGCVPTTCVAQSKNCGSISNGCGNTLDCGSCSSGQSCMSNVCSQPVNTTKESWVWIYTDFDINLTNIATHITSFTHASPTFYTINYNYQSGVAYYSTCPNNNSDYNCIASGPNNFDGLGLTAKTYTASLHSIGMKVVPAIYGGGANGGTDVGITNILNNATYQSNFITAMVSEAVNNNYDGYNLDWETSGIGSKYAQSFVNFVNVFKAVLNAQLPNATLSVDVIVSDVNGTWCSGNDGYLDFGLLSASSIDRVIIEDYSGEFQTAGWTVPTTCGTNNYYGSSVLDTTNPVGCDFTLSGMLIMMCPANINADKVVIGLAASVNGNNPIAGESFTYIKDYGFTRVAVWPQYDDYNDQFMSNLSINPPNATWYGLLSNFLTN